MSSYVAFGFRIESAIDLPELDDARDPGAPDWLIRMEPALDRTHEGSLFGADMVYDQVHVRAYALGPSLRLAFDDTGTFEVRAAERVIAWRPGPAATPVAVRADLLGRVMALAAHVDGHLCLHASAVSIGGRAIALLGPKLAGKSTLALALVRHGARLLSDDTLVVQLRPDGSAWAAPGVQRVRLWPDSARALAAAVSNDPGAKPTVDRLTPNQLEAAEVPLAACYVLEASPVPDRPAHAAARRERMSQVHAALACVRFSKLGSLAGGAEGVAVLGRASTLVGAVPVYGASVQKDLRTIDDVASVFMGWHDPARDAGSGAGL